MRILLLAKARSVHTTRWANVFSQKGHEVVLATCKDHASDTEVLDKRVDVRILPHPSASSRGYILNARYLKQLADEVDPDVVNAHYASGYGTLARASRLPRVVLSVWGSDVFSFPERSWLHRALIRGNLRYPDGIAATSRVMAQRVRELVEEPEFPVTVTPFGVDIERFNRSSGREQPSTDVVTIGTIRTLKPLYGLATLVEATARVREELETERSPVRVRLEIYGDGPDRSTLSALAAQRGLADIVSFHGRIPNRLVPEALSRMDIFAIPSLRESFGVAAVEAMASSVPVVSSDAGGLPEVVTDGVTGLQFPAGDSQALTIALLKLVRDPGLRARMGVAGRADAAERFDFSHNADLLLEALSAVAGSRDS